VGLERIGVWTFLCDEHFVLGEVMMDRKRELIAMATLMSDPDYKETESVSSVIQRRIRSIYQKTPNGAMRLDPSLDLSPPTSISR
jgi:hypothetical protein